ncbi:DNA polymerase beta domain-containing protein [Candidatus Termititenax persephonae]|uniref:DNA polymerase beta domain-containing protein n=1 Tax=Candidatus Termititenax persephonae TaxID=2218525 RepID=A0A388TIE3_9BACT|nr:DNA polymerase beta domain-containing protein [Candidatus Termititenax persephonae]
MEKEVQEQIETIKKIIVATVPVERIYLFGSYAYGTPRPDSDLDFYVIMKDDAPYRNIEAMRRIGKALWDYDSKSTDILVTKKSKFQYRLSAPTLEREVFAKGRVIYG